jgi:photosynthetic reaction center H subunit
MPDVYNFLNTVAGIDVAILCVLAFVIFFAGLIYHLRQEDKREGYPLLSARGGRDPKIETMEGFPPLPKPKTFILPHGHGTVTVPRRDPPQPMDDIHGRPVYGTPLTTDHNPLDVGLGAAAWQKRKPNFPDQNIHGEPKIISLNVSPQWYMAPGDADVRGWSLVDMDFRRVGTVYDVWFDRAEYHVRYFSYTVDDQSDIFIAPAYLCNLDAKRRIVRVRTLPQEALANAPVRAGDVITWEEEDRVNGYFAGGFLYDESAMRRELGGDAR